MKKIEARKMFQNMKFQPHSLSHLHFELMPLFLFWGAAWLAFDKRGGGILRNFVPKIAKMPEMKALLDAIYNLRLGLPINVFISFPTQFKLLGGPNPSLEDERKVREELKEYIKGEIGHIKIDPSQRHSKHNVMSFGRYSFTLSVGVAIFMYGRDGVDEKFISNLYGEIQASPVNYRYILRCMFNALNREDWWNHVPKNEIKTLLSADYKYIKILSRECMTAEENVASMIIGGMKTPDSRLKRKQVENQKWLKESKKTESPVLFPYEWEDPNGI